MNKNIIKLFAILVMCFMIGAVLVACGAEPVQGEKGDKGDTGAPGAPGVPGGDICENGAHTWDDEKIWVEDHYYDPATGEESAGSYLRACVDCGFAQFVEGEHNFDEGVVVNPTCTEIGGLKKTCSDCGYVKIDDVKDALGHTIAVAWDAENIDASWVARAKDANVCALLQDTVYDTECTVCGEIADTKTVEKVGHKAAVAFDKDNIDASWIARAKDANECALTQDTIYDSFCPVCNGVAATEIVTAPGHQVETAWNANDIPACWTADSKVNAICDCEEDTIYRADCVECGETVFKQTVPATGHKYENWAPAINKVDAPSHTVNKIQVSPCTTCSGCDCPMGEKIVEKASGHTWGNWYFVDGVNPTLGSSATARRECTACKAEGYVDYGTKSTKFSNTETKTLAQLAEFDGSDWVYSTEYNVTVVTPDDCITNRVVTFTHKATGLVIANVTLPDTMSGHTIEGACTVVTAPDRYNAGTATIACKTCGEVLTYTLPALGFKNSTSYTTKKVENADALCEEIEYTYTITIAGNANGNDANGSFTYSQDIAGDDHHDTTNNVPEKWAYVISEDKKTISTVYLCENCKHWIVIDINPNPDYVEE